MNQKISHIPPIQTLRAFEASVRLSSFTRAADELSLTQGAVSQHIRALEKHMGTVLFSRTRDGAVPTAQAQALAVQVRFGLEVLVRAFGDSCKTVSAVKKAKPYASLFTVSVLPAFASRWLLPRLDRFREVYPDINLDIRESKQLARLDSRDGIDVALRYGPGAWPGLISERWMTEEVFPVVSPCYRGGQLPQQYADLADCTLLCHTMQPWELWLQAAKLGGLNFSQENWFNDVEQLLQAAANGEGVALARRSLVEGDIASGRLVRLWNQSVEDVHAHFIVWRPGSSKCDEIAALRDWLHHEVKIGKDFP